MSLSSSAGADATRPPSLLDLTHAWALVRKRLLGAPQFAKQLAREVGVLGAAPSTAGAPHLGPGGYDVR